MKTALFSLKIMEIFLFDENEYTIGIGYDKLDGILSKEAVPIKN